MPSTSKSQFHGEASGFDIKVSYNDRSTVINFINDKLAYSFSNVFLRDSSTSEKSIDPSSGQKLFTTVQIMHCKPSKVAILDKDTINIQWSDGDESNYSRDFLETSATVDNRVKSKSLEKHVTLWNHRGMDLGKFPTKELTFDYKEYLEQNKTLYDALVEVNKFGVAFIKNVPEKEGTVKALGERIGKYLRMTFYGETWNVKSAPNAELKNIAYTDKFIPFHQDLLYYESPPGLQLLHFIKNSATGGDSSFVDGYAAARHVKDTDPEAFLALTTVPINFQYKNGDYSYHLSRFMVVEDETILASHIYSERDSFKEINYAPPFQAPFDFGISSDVDSIAGDNSAKESGDRHLFNDFLRGMKLFEEYINAPENQLKFKIPEGTCVIFDNRRVLHARDNFDPQSGERWLQGCYVDKEAYLSQSRVLKEKFGKK
ncbi:hypothetical protein WICPIJ_000764 [Wickerhamomyces pijperi]|uniref:TauD/TfdA-like domain-containing protein n=1 Tax=Wickerhamomyces pijperi TaxID=599730 RepID=A0A9P8QFX8_WICPI|nr:hypothetical protein WICPIJ_000764 [Wickerhamomyces pijperi]